MLLLAAAFALRAWAPGRMAIEHFDEGVYASNLYSDPIEFAELSYPDRHLYAPPLWPKILEWILILTGMNPHAVMWGNVVLGTALVAAVWWTTRELTFQRDDPRAASLAALAAASLIALGDIFIQYSRTALTDIPVAVWMTLAVGAGGRAYRTGNWGWGLTAGLLTAAAWWTKYNGWLPLAILGAGLMGWLIFTAAGRRSLTSSSGAEKNRSKKIQSKKSKTTAPSVNAEPSGSQRLLLWGVMIAVASVVWFPYLSSLQPIGGYSSVAENHRGYITGLSGWWESAARHLTVDHFYSRWSTAIGLLFAIGLCWWGSNASRHSKSGEPSGRPHFKDQILSIAAALIGVAIVLTLGLIPVLLVGALLVLLYLFSRPLYSAPLGWWILLAWVAGLTLATPMYRPYPRLILPWMISMAMAAGLGIALSLLRKNPVQETQELNSFRLSPLVAGLTFLGLFAAVIVIGVSSPRWLEDRNGLRSGAQAIQAAITEDLGLHPEKASTVPDLDCVIYVLAEPGLFYHLASDQNASLRFITQPAADLGMLDSGKIDSRVPAYLVTGLHAEKEASALANSTSNVKSVGEVAYFPSSLVLLDDVSPTDQRVVTPTEVPLRIWAIER